MQEPCTSSCSASLVSFMATHRGPITPADDAHESAQVAALTVPAPSQAGGVVSVAPSHGCASSHLGAHDRFKVLEFAKYTQSVAMRSRLLQEPCKSDHCAT
jgi:hypothetical protein